MSLLEKLGITHPHQEFGKFYRYEMIDPRSGKVFYVGKGTGERMYQHEKETQAILKSGKMMLLKHKHKVIIEIWDAGYEVVYAVTYRNDDEEAVYQAESKRIRELGLEHLTNATYGHRPRSKRAAHFLR